MPTDDLELDVRRTTVTACLVVVGLAGCVGGYDPASGQQILDDLTAAALVDCVQTRSPVPDVITCVSENGDEDVTVALTDDGPARMVTVAGDGPHLVGDTWVVLTFDGDETRVDRFREALGGGVVYVRGDDGDLVPR